MLKDNFHCKFINRSKKIISFYNNKKFDPKRSSNFYFDSTSDSNDYTSLKYFFKKVLFFKYLKLIIKDTLYSVFYGNPIIYNGDLTKKKYDKIIVSWANKKNFKLDGSHQDKFFNSKHKDYQYDNYFKITTFFKMFNKKDLWIEYCKKHNGYDSARNNIVWDNTTKSTLLLLF